MAKANTDLDDVDTKIILALQEDARRPYKSIAKDLNVSEGTISNRVGRLIGKGILKLEARVNPFALAHKVVALVGINVKNRFHPQALKKIQALPKVSSVWVTTGKYDLYMEVMADSINDLNNFLFDSGFSEIEEVTFTETYVMLQSETKFLKLTKD